MKAILWRTAVWMMRLLPAAIRRFWLTALCGAASARRDAKAGLRELCHADTAVRWHLNQCAIRYDGGIHPKHRLMLYHQFFANRIQPGERVLDVGCGGGHVAYSLAKGGGQVTGVDISRDQINAATARYIHPNLRFVCCDARGGLPPGPFEVVVLSNVLEHLDDRATFLRSLAASTGMRKALIRVPAATRDWLVPLRVELGLPSFSDPTHRIEYSAESFAAEMRAANLRVESMLSVWGEIWAETSPEHQANTGEGSLS